MPRGFSPQMAKGRGASTSQALLWTSEEEPKSKPYGQVVVVPNHTVFGLNGDGQAAWVLNSRRRTLLLSRQPGQPKLGPTMGRLH